MNREDAIKMTLEVIKEKKLENSSIGEIVKKMDISPGNLYYHFKSKNELYREVLEYSINEIADSLDKVKLDVNKKNNLLYHYICFIIYISKIIYEYYNRVSCSKGIFYLFI